VNAEPVTLQSSQRAKPETVRRTDNQRIISQQRNAEPAAPQLQRAKFDAASRPDDQRSISRSTNIEPAVRKIDLLPP
jgi:hypothetical protein